MPDATAASISALDRPAASRSRVTAGRVPAAGGWSHSWVTPTTWSPAPIANRISVTDGSSETMRIPTTVTSRILVPRNTRRTYSQKLFADPGSAKHAADLQPETRGGHDDPRSQRHPRRPTRPKSARVGAQPDHGQHGRRQGQDHRRARHAHAGPRARMADL